jgi:uncharacterized protein
VKIEVRVKTCAKFDGVEMMDDGSYKVSVKAKPVEGKANDAVIRALAEHFGIPRSKIALVTGTTSKRKIFRII